MSKWIFYAIAIIGWGIAWKVFSGWQVIALTMAIMGTMGFFEKGNN